MSRARALRQLCRLLRGQGVVDPDWTAVLSLANRALVTPRLDARLPEDAPDDVRTFVSEVARRNRDRNLRILAQLSDAAVALNVVGIVPTALKGAACLVRGGPATPRMLADLDLLVAPGEIDQAIAALTAAGFSQLGEDFRADRHEVIGLGRTQDVARIDLHQRPPGPAGFAAELASTGAQVWTAGAGRVRLPASDRHILMQALHDQLQDKAYWSGGFDLRHAWDIHDLIVSGTVDWSRLAARAPTALIGHALETQLAVCVMLTGAPAPSWTFDLGARLNARRQWLQYVWPRLRWPLAALVLGLEGPAFARHRQSDGEHRAEGALPPVSRDWRRFFHDLDAEVLGRL